VHNESYVGAGDSCQEQTVTPTAILSSLSAIPLLTVARAARMRQPDVENTAILIDGFDLCCCSESGPESVQSLDLIRVIQAKE
jgi:hypothetical protein